VKIMEPWAQMIDVVEEALPIHRRVPNGVVVELWDTSRSMLLPVNLGRKGQLNNRCLTPALRGKDRCEQNQLITTITESRVVIRHRDETDSAGYG
jgi:hypothetical protein